LSVIVHLGEKAIRYGGVKNVKLFEELATSF